MHRTNGQYRTVG